MIRAVDLRPLQNLARMVSDHRLEALRRANQARAETQAQLDALVAGPADPALHPAAAALALVSYEAWADGRRRDLIQLLARQKAAVAEAEAEARLAFGRAEVLGRLAATRKVR